MGLVLMMRTAVVFWLYLIWPALAWSVRPLENDRGGQAVIQDVWPDLPMLTAGFLGKSLLPPAGLNGLESSLPVPFQPWSFMDTGTRFDLKVMNSSWNGLSETNVYKRGEPMYLQVSSSSVPGQELYLHSCYAAPSPNFNDKSRIALIINKGCVSSKQSAVKFVSRQSNVVNLLLDTSGLKLSQGYVHCTVALSDHGLTPDTKSCNYISDKSRWVELSGQTKVCDCCATKCRGPSYYEAPFGEFKALVSAGPLSIKEQEHEKQVLTDGPSIASPQIEASDTSNRKPWIMSGASPSSTGKGWIMSGASVSSGSVVNRSPWQTRPVTADLIVSQSLGDVLSLFLPGPVHSSPVLEIEIGYPQKKGRGQSGAPANLLWQNPAATFEARLQREDPVRKTPSFPSGRLELASMVDGYPLADSPDSALGRRFGDVPKPSVEGFLEKPEEDLRGDVFTNFREPQPDQVPSVETSTAPKNDVPELVKAKDEGDVLVVTQTKMLFKKVNADAVRRSESLTKSIYQGSDGPSSPGYGDEQGVRKSRLELEQRRQEVGEKTEDEGLSELATEKELVSSLMVLLRRLDKML